MNIHCLLYTKLLVTNQIFLDCGVRSNIKVDLGVIPMCLAMSLVLVVTWRGAVDAVIGWLMVKSRNKEAAKAH